MEIKSPIFADFEFEQMYHLFTRVSGNEMIFRTDENYRYFLEKISKFLLPYLEIYAYCLVPQRFSLLICFRSSKEILMNLNLAEKNLNKDQEHKFLMQPISNMLNSYAKAYNKFYQRKGALFIDFIKREKIEDEDSLMNVFKEIHLIPIKSYLVKQPEEWKYSSFNSYFDIEKPTKINRSFMLSFFESREELIKFHQT